MSTSQQPAGNELEAPLVAAPAEESKNSKALIISFVAMVFVGLGNKIFQVLMTYPMNNYPLFVSLLTTFVYLPASFAYIIPMQKWGTAITKEAEAIPKRVFAVMGLLDSIAGVMQTLAVNYLVNGSLIILIMQAAIPVSMMITKWLLKIKYKLSQYVGALIVAVGILAVLLPKLISPDDSTGKNAGIWAAVLVLSCVPMCLSSVYKEKALGETEIDAVYLNGWIAIFQFLAGLPLLIPSAPAANLAIADVPGNLRDGFLCFMGQNSIMTGENPDDCAMGPLYVTCYMCFNLGYNILIILILKYGSSNLLWLAMTLMVPLGNVTFSLPFMPKNKPLKVTDIVGLLIIMTGLVIYRFYEKIKAHYAAKRNAGREAARRSLSVNADGDGGDDDEIEPSPIVTSDSPRVDTPVRGGAHVTRKQFQFNTGVQQRGPSSRAGEGAGAYSKLADDAA